MPDITIGRLRGGLCAVWRDASGKRHRHQLAARDRKAAEAEALDLYRRLQPAGIALTVSGIWAAYREDHAGRRIGGNMEWSGRAILPHFGALRPDQIDAAACRAYAREIGRAHV